MHTLKLILKEKKLEENMVAEMKNYFIIIYIITHSSKTSYFVDPSKTSWLTIEQKFILKTLWLIFFNKAYMIKSSI